MQAQVNVSVNHMAAVERLRTEIEPPLFFVVSVHTMPSNDLVVPLLGLGLPRGHLLRGPLSRPAPPVSLLQREEGLQILHHRCLGYIEH